jgi:hypothetical protein
MKSRRFAILNSQIPCPPQPRRPPLNPEPGDDGLSEGETLQITRSLAPLEFQTTQNWLTRVVRSPILTRTRTHTRALRPLALPILPPFPPNLLSVTPIFEPLSSHDQVT